MSKIVIPAREFEERIIRIQAEMEKNSIDTILVYGDEYRKENLRYVCNFWPIFERAVCVIPRCGEAVLAGAPEGENYAREMSVLKNYCNVKEFACVSVPEEIDYPLAKFAKLSDIIGNALQGGKKLGIVGWFDIPAPIFKRIEEAACGAALFALVACGKYKTAADVRQLIQYT